MFNKNRTASLRDIHLINAKLKSIEKRIEECRYILDTVEDIDTVAHFTDVLRELKELQAKYTEKLSEVRSNGKRRSCS